MWIILSIISFGPDTEVELGLRRAGVDMSHLNVEIKPSSANSCED